MTSGQLLFVCLFGTLFLGGHFQNHPDSLILQKYQSVSNQSVKHNLVQMPSLNLTPKLSFKRFVCLSVTLLHKEQTLVVLGLLLCLFIVHKTFGIFNLLETISFRQMFLQKYSMGR